MEPGMLTQLPEIMSIKGEVISTCNGTCGIGRKEDKVKKLYDYFLVSRTKICILGDVFQLENVFYPHDPVLSTLKIQ